MANKLEWEKIEHNASGNLSRAKVPGGWLVMVTEDEIHPTRMETGYTWKSSIAFVPDPHYIWLNDAIVYEFDAWLAEVTVQTKKCFPEHTPNAAFMKANYYDKHMSPNAAAYEYIAKAQFTN